MANKLKAFVRYDGQGNVIAGGPLLSRTKPKVGNWVEIQISQCCNPTTTTSTTTSTTTTVAIPTCVNYDIVVASNVTIAADYYDCDNAPQTLDYTAPEGGGTTSVCAIVDTFNLTTGEIISITNTGPGSCSPT